MAGYTKLFASIVHSSIWRAPDHVRLVWITMLAMADREGNVEASVPGLADASRVSLEHCLAALAVLSAPDEWSRTKTDEGRRIREVHGGWEIINYGSWRDRMSAAVQRQQVADRVARFRARRRNADVTPETHTEAEATATTDQKQDPPTPLAGGVAVSLPGGNSRTRKKALTRVAPPARAEAVELHVYWQQTMGFPNRALTADRLRHLHARLREGMTVPKGKKAIDGCRSSPWHMGDNPQATPYNEIESIFRNAKKVDEMCARAEAGGGVRTSALSPEAEKLVAPFRPKG